VGPSRSTPPSGSRTDQSGPPRCGPRPHGSCRYPRTVRGYLEDLAYVHDAGYVAVAEAGARALIELLGKRGVDRGLVVELGCGSGASSRLLTEAGYDVVGIDASPAMIELARRRAPRAAFRIGSLIDARLPPVRGRHSPW
jgi:SAM-dependent methyltransferase